MDMADTAGSPRHNRPIYTKMQEPACIKSNQNTLLIISAVRQVQEAAQRGVPPLPIHNLHRVIKEGHLWIPASKLAHTCR